MFSNSYYVYGLIHPQTHAPFYIGMGRGDRAFQHGKPYRSHSSDNHRKYKLIKNLISSDNPHYVIFYYKNLDSTSAVYLEKFLIRVFGRQNIDKDGILTNIHPGGIHNDGNFQKKRVRQYDLEGNYIHTFSSISAAARSLKCDTAHISYCCNNPNSSNTSNDFIWTFDNDEDANIRLKILKTQQVICQYDLNGNYLNYYKCMKDAAKELNVDMSGISGCVAGKFRNSGNFIWKKFPIDKIPHKIPASGLKTKKIAQLDINGNFIRYHESIAAAGFFLGKENFTSISAVVNGRQLTAFGFKWKAVEK